MDKANNILEELPYFKQKRKMPLMLTVNSIHYRLIVNPTDRVMDLLRDRLLLFGDNVSCGIDRYENHAILLDGKMTHPSMLMAYQVNGKSITIIEGSSRSIAEVHSAYFSPI